MKQTNKEITIDGMKYILIPTQEENNELSALKKAKKFIDDFNIIDKLDKYGYVLKKELYNSYKQAVDENVNNVIFNQLISDKNPSVFVSRIRINGKREYVYLKAA